MLYLFTEKFIRLKLIFMDTEWYIIFKTKQEDKRFSNNGVLTERN